MSISITKKKLFYLFRWIGSNTSPDGAGQGKASSDRSNLLMLQDKVKLNKNSKKSFD